MSYKCTLCNLILTNKDLDDEWCCGRCTMDDWIDLDPIDLSKYQKNIESESHK